MNIRRSWQAFGATVRGANHRRNGNPNQDALGWTPYWSGLGPPVALVVSDGHGSPRSFRSHIGAALAVRLSRSEIIRGCWARHRNSHSHPHQASLEILDQIPIRLVQSWRSAVETHLDLSPFCESELELLTNKDGEAAVKSVVDNPFLAYGATLLVILVLPDQIAYFQLGDGDILAVLSDGEVQRPLPSDSRLFANATTSLCSPQAWKDFRFKAYSFEEQNPALVLASSDGYSNSFREEAGFVQVGSDLLSMIRSAGIPAIRMQLPVWLEEASQNGSGDDISLGLLCRLDVPA